MTALDTPLTPLRFLARAAEVHPDKTAIVDGPRRFSYREFADLVDRTARAFRSSGMAAGDRVAYLAANSAEMLMAHFAVPLAGGVLVAINTRLASQEVHFICEHSGAVLLAGDAGLLGKLAESADESVPALGDVQEVIVLPAQDGSQPELAGATRHNHFLTRDGADPPDWSVADENATITINYTSGTTGRPKGVMYTHRGGYLNALGEVIHQGFTPQSIYLWTLPMFHCNGWCSTWALTAVAGTHVCLRAVRADAIWRLLEDEQVSHLAGAPTVLTTMADAKQATVLSRPLTVVTAGAPPSPTIIEKFNTMRARVIHVYGLTETYGPYSTCEPQDGWSDLDSAELATKMARQGVGMVTSDPMRVVEIGNEHHADSVTGGERAGDGPAETRGGLVDVPADGQSMGEIVMRGNTVMKGYFRDEEATEEAFAGGWFHSGDLGVKHPDGYIQLLDRAKDVVVSGGENISTVEVEQALLRHPSVQDVAVIGVPDERWGERPKAFVVLVAGAEKDEAALISHVRGQLAAYKTPRSVEFLAELPKGSTGKVRKYELRDREWSGQQSRIQG